MYLLNHDKQTKFDLCYLNPEPFADWINTGTNPTSLFVAILCSFGNKMCMISEVANLCEAIFKFWRNSNSISLGGSSDYVEVGCVHDYIKTEDEHISELALMVPKSIG